MWDTLMVFSSVTFIFLYLPITLVGYYLLRKQYSNIWLLLMSLLFFAWAEPRHLFIILASIIINYFSGVVIAAIKGKNAKKAALIATVLLNLTLLFYYKYYDFCAESLNYLFGLNINIKHIVLPIGISFFTFQGMSYVIDVYRGEASAQKNPINVALYIALFPQLVAGPIVRYSSISDELVNRREDLYEMTAGIDRFIIGLAKKAILANSLASIADSIWDTFTLNNTMTIAWLGSIAYSLQIFYDFSGYSDMAIGLGKMFGFHFPENFRQPYISLSITEFWRRWHISLSGWFRDYLYIPLGGSRNHVYRNLAIVFFVTGLWHGASWHYVLWGAFHGILILLERRIGIYKATNTFNGIRKLLHHLLTLLLINIGWVLFRAETIKDAVNYLLNMIGMALPAKPGFSIGWYLNRWNVFIMIIALCMAFIPDDCHFDSLLRAIGKGADTFSGKVIFRSLLLVLFVASIMRIIAGTYNPFIYYQF